MNQDSRFWTKRHAGACLQGISKCRSVNGQPFGMGPRVSIGYCDHMLFHGGSCQWIVIFL